MVIVLYWWTDFVDAWVNVPNLENQFIKSYDFLEQGLANFYFKGWDSKYFQLCEP